jgi:hypothetical protein
MLISSPEGQRRSGFFATAKSKMDVSPLFANSDPNDHFFYQALSEFVWERGRGLFVPHISC